MNEIAKIIEERILKEEAIKAEICQRFDNYVEKRSTFDSVFKELSTEKGMDISKQNRKRNNYVTSTLSYGEITFEAFGSLILGFLDLGIDFNKLYYFVDIGSGTGKTIVSASLLNIFDRCTGIEILADLIKVSNQALRQYLKLSQDNEEDHGILNFIHGDATFIDWSDADVVYVHATCFDDEMMTRITETALKMKEGSVFISISIKLPSKTDSLFSLLAVREIEVDFGNKAQSASITTSTAYIYRRSGEVADGCASNPKAYLKCVLSRHYPDFSTK